LWLSKTKSILDKVKHGSGALRLYNCKKILRIAYKGCSVKYRKTETLYALYFCRLNINFIQDMTSEYAEVIYAHICCVLLFALT
jgi:hypothetical protein